MNDKDAHASVRAQVDETEQALLGVLIIDADAALHGCGKVDGVGDRRHAVGDQTWLAHQTGAEASALDPVGRTTDIEIDLGVAEVCGDPRRSRQVARVGAAQLQRQRLLAGIERQQPGPITMQDRAGGQHLSVKPRVRRKLAMERPTMPVCPVHHRRNTESMM